MQAMMSGRIAAGTSERAKNAAQARNLPNARLSGPMGAVSTRWSVCKMRSPAKLRMVMSGKSRAAAAHMPLKSVLAALPSAPARKNCRQA